MRHGAKVTGQWGKEKLKLESGEAEKLKAESSRPIARLATATHRRTQTDTDEKELNV
jgi:hypothetical protein